MKTSSPSNNQDLFTPSMRNVFNPNLQDASVLVELHFSKSKVRIVPENR
jgi:hypothetical protein